MQVSRCWHPSGKGHAIQWLLPTPTNFLLLLRLIVRPPSDEAKTKMHTISSTGGIMETAMQTPQFHLHKPLTIRKLSVSSLFKSSIWIFTVLPSRYVSAILCVSSSFSWHFSPAILAKPFYRSVVSSIMGTGTKASTSASISTRMPSRREISVVHRESSWFFL